MLGMAQKLILQNKFLINKKKQNGKGGQIGFIAQQVEKIVPEAVFKTSNDDYGFNDRPLVALLTKTVQELEARITKLEKLVQDLLSK